MATKKSSVQFHSSDQEVNGFPATVWHKGIQTIQSPSVLSTDLVTLVQILRKQYYRVHSIATISTETFSYDEYK